MHQLFLQPGTVWLDAARPEAGVNRSLLFEHPREVLVARQLTEVVPVLEQAEAARRAGCWVAGFAAYEAGGAWLPIVSVPEAPLIWLGVYEAPPTAESPLQEQGCGQFQVEGLHASRDFATYARQVQAVRALIQEGDVYQINLTFPMEARFSGDPLALYAALRAQQPVTYGAFIETEEETVLSLSPELFFRVDGTRIRAKPMKGTAARGTTDAEDREIAAQLQADAKNRAENLMIVDLLRNDLSRVARPGSVRVPHLFSTEKHPTLIQMTSTVEGQVKQGTGLPEYFEALFPCGSVTGAPKRRAMTRIAELERQPRGVYCGAIGYAAPHDEIVFNVAIRTLEIRNTRLRMGVGSGVVWDSNAADEYEECLLKARFLTQLVV